MFEVICDPRLGASETSLLNSQVILTTGWLLITLSVGRTTVHALHTVWTNSDNIKPSYRALLQDNMGEPLPGPSGKLNLCQLPPSSLSTDTSVVEVFVKIWSVVLREVINRHMDKHLVKHNLGGGGNNSSNKNSRRPHSSASDKLWFTYLLSMLVYFQSIVNKVTWLLKFFWFSYFRDPEADKFQNLISSSLSTDTCVVTFSWRSVQ